MQLFAGGRWVWRTLSVVPLLMLIGVMGILWISGLIFPDRRRYVLQATGQCLEMFEALVDSSRA